MIFYALAVVGFGLAIGACRPNPRCAKSVPRQANTARHAVDGVDRDRPSELGISRRYGIA